MERSTDKRQGGCSELPRPFERTFGPVAGSLAEGIGWLVGVAVAETRADARAVLLVAFMLLAALELWIPFWAERGRGTAWHPHHIAERYGLFAIILLGEGVLAASGGVTRALDA